MRKKAGGSWNVSTTNQMASHAPLFRPRNLALLPVLSVLLLGATSSAMAVEDASPTSAGERPILAAPVVEPIGVPPTASTDRPPDAMVRDGGVLLELWVPEDPVQSGSWLPATIRITNLGNRPIRHAGGVGDDRCENPTETALALQGLFDPGESWEGNTAIFKDAFLSTAPLGRLRTDLLESTAPVDCGSRIGPGRSVEAHLLMWPRYAFRDQPLPSGTADVETWFSFTRLGKPARGWTVLEVSAPVSIVGRTATYPAPQELVDTAMRDPEFRAWLDTRDLTTDWNIDLEGIYAPRGYTFAGLGYAGGVAPEETMVLGVFADGDGAVMARVVIDPWTTEIEAVVIG